MLSPLIPYAIRGAIWYQGEANAARPQQYRTLLPAMIGDWREAWGQGDFPFYLVQLANLHGRNWPELREAQRLTAEKAPNSGMAVTIDIGERDNVHPANKQEVGRRLALIALARTYGKQIVYSGPVFKTVVAKGEQAIVSFDHRGGGLLARGGRLTGFDLAGSDGVFHPADAVIVGEVVRLSHALVREPTAVRYAWADDPACSLCNREGLPAVPFRAQVAANAAAR
jgi:sialate O-acetylesterase